MDHETIIYEKRDGIAFVTLNRPEKLNAMNRRMQWELESVYVDVRNDAAIGALIISGAGERAFSSGADIATQGWQPPGEYPLGTRPRRYSNIEDAVAEVGKPTIAAVHGYCLGGGIELVLACDMIVAAEDAQFGLPEATIGTLSDSGGIVRLAKAIGRSKAMEIVMTGNRLSAGEALRLGLVNYVVPRSQMLAKAEELARKVLSHAPLSVSAGREVVERALDLPLDAALLVERELAMKVNRSEDHQEGSRAFAEKRQPRWKGR
ncbi:MAG: enoyl-CoA hydratase/isomerase family protein [Dehalococcoidia bacterium]